MNSEFLGTTEFIDHQHPKVLETARAISEPGKSDLENAVALYYYVRDAIRYNPYALKLDAEGFKASTVLAAGEGWCVPKAVLLAALCRAIGIPAGLGYADVVNHLSTEQLRENMETDVFYFHGYCSIYLNDRWVKSTPAFNLSLCEKFGLKPLEFDGVHDSLYHEFDKAGNRHMEYVRERGEYADVPLNDLLDTFRAHYPKLMKQYESNACAPLPDSSEWENDVARETGGRTD